MRLEQVQLVRKEVVLWGIRGDLVVESDEDRNVSDDSEARVQSIVLYGIVHPPQALLVVEYQRRHAFRVRPLLVLVR